jgi:hypothetical protein
MVPKKTNYLRNSSQKIRNLILKGSQKINLILSSFNELKQSVPLTKNMYFSSRKCLSQIQFVYELIQ